MWAFVLKRLQERNDSAKSAEERKFISGLIDLAHARRVPEEFVASFSENGDDLSQWRAYCPGEAGFSIGFSSAALRSQWVSDPAGGRGAFVGVRLVKVSYVSDTDKAEIDLAIDGTLQISVKYNELTASPLLPSSQQFVHTWFTIIAPSYKNAAFRAENEWRIVVMKPHRAMPGQRFRAGKSTLIPYVEVDLNLDMNRKPLDNYMIRKVIVGPAPNPDLSVEALGNLFLSKGQNQVLIEKSDVPFRHW